MTGHLLLATLDEEARPLSLRVLGAYAEKLGKKPAFDAWLAIAPVPCQTALTALPVELTPMLQGFRVQGTFQTQLHLAIDLSDLDQGLAAFAKVGKALGVIA